MVRIENNKLIIEIETNDPIGELQVWKTSLIQAIKGYNYEDFDHMPITYLAEMLQNLSPDDNQLKRGLLEEGSTITFKKGITQKQKCVIVEALEYIDRKEKSGFSPNEIAKYLMSIERKKA